MPVTPALQGQGTVMSQAIKNSLEWTTLGDSFAEANLEATVHIRPSPLGCSH